MTASAQPAASPRSTGASSSSKRWDKAVRGGCSALTTGSSGATWRSRRCTTIARPTPCIRSPWSSRRGRAFATRTWCAPTSCCARARARFPRGRPTSCSSSSAACRYTARYAPGSEPPSDLGRAGAGASCARSITSTGPGSCTGISSRETFSWGRRGGGSDASSSPTSGSRRSRGARASRAHLRLDPLRRPRDDPGIAVDGRADLYGLGVLLFYLAHRTAAARLEVSRALASLAPRRPSRRSAARCGPSFPRASPSSWSASPRAPRDARPATAAEALRDLWGRRPVRAGGRRAADLLARRAGRGSASPSTTRARARCGSSRFRAASGAPREPRAAS